MKPFYVRHKNREEAIEVIDRAVANGAGLDEGVEGQHYGTCEYDPDQFMYVGVDCCLETLFSDEMYHYEDSNPEELTMEQVREMYPLPDERNGSITEGSVSGETEGRKFQIGDQVTYCDNISFTGKVMGYDGEYNIIKTSKYDEDHAEYEAFSDFRLVKQGSMLDEIIQILYNTQGIENQAEEILKLFNKGEEK